MRKDPVSSNPAECPAFRTVKAYKIKIKSPTISNVQCTHVLICKHKIITHLIINLCKTGFIKGIEKKGNQNIESKKAYFLKVHIL